MSTKDKKLSVTINLAGTSNTGKTLLAAKLSAFFKSLGIIETKVHDEEIHPEDFGELCIQAPTTSFDYAAQDTSVDISVSPIYHPIDTSDEPAAQRHMLEANLTAEQLEARFSKSYQHPQYPRTAWLAEIHERRITDGYWVWLKRQLAK